MNSSKDQSEKTLAREDASAPQSPRKKEDLLRGLTELANLRDEASAFERLERDWPGFVRVDERIGPVRASFVRPTIPAFLPERFAHMYRRREALRRIWCGDSEMLAMLLVPEVAPEEAPQNEREAYIEKTDTDGRPIELAKPLPITFDWQRGQITYKPQTEFQSALYALFRQSRLAKVCANSDCPARYFVARKTSQEYCSDGCAKVFQREWKRQWWANHGKEWRRRHTQKKSREKREGKR